MVWMTIQDLDKHLPLDVIDANGMIIMRGVIGFDPVTGEIESQVLEPTMEARVLSFNSEGHIVTRREFYPAPLLWKRISQADVERHYQEGYWDQHGR